VVLTPEELDAAIAAEKLKLAQAQAAELAKLQAEADALAAAKVAQARAAEKQAEQVYIDNVENELAKPLEEQKASGPPNALFFTVGLYKFTHRLKAPGFNP
jgi:septal ring factor EnvC (AmiA/AmiB activator)